jgi:AcrR family transcriptional regulator
MSRPAGRPRLLTIERIVREADRLGPDGFTMTAVAEGLGVSVGTLYQYVSDRDELIRLVLAERMKNLPIPQDSGQHWTTYLRDYVDGLVAALSSDTYNVVHFYSMGSMLQLELRVSEAFYAAMVARGFALEEAVEIHGNASVIAIGAAMARGRDRIAVERSGSVPAAMDEALSDLDPQELPLVREAIPAYETRTEHIHHTLVDALIQRIANTHRE